MIELAIEQFQGVSETINFELLMQLARKQFHFRGTDQDALDHLERSKDFEMAQRKNPQTGIGVWVVRDLRRCHSSSAKKLVVPRAEECSSDLPETVNFQSESEAQ